MTDDFPYIIRRNLFSLFIASILGMETSAGIRDGVCARCTEHNQERQRKELIPHGLERLIKPDSCSDISGLLGSEFFISGTKEGNRRGSRAVAFIAAVQIISTTIGLNRQYALKYNEANRRSGAVG